MPAVLRLEASDAGPLSMLATLKSAVLVTTLGPQPVEGGELEVPLCGGALGQQLLDSAPGVVHELTVTVTDDAGNVSAPVVLELEVEPVLPPIRVAMVSGVDEWDLANFSFQDGTLHVPFAPAGEGGADDLPGRYRLARYEVVNPWDLDLLMVSSIAAPLQVERGVRRSYLKLSGAQNACSPGQCAYLWKDLLPGEDVPQGPCTLAKTFPVELETLDVEQEVVVIAGGTTKPLAPTTKVSLPAHGSVAVDLLAPLAGTCFVTAPTVHSYAGSQTLVYEPKPSCEGVPASADVLPFGYTSSTASCMLKASAGGGGGVFANPRIIEALYVNSIVSDAPGLFVNYSAVGAEVRSGASAPVKGSFFKELPNFEVTPSVEPY
jgi:hypothetical protein